MYSKVTRKREIIWRKALEETLFHVADRHKNDAQKARGDVRTSLDTALQHGRKIIWERLNAGDISGVRAAAAMSYLTDQVIRALYSVTTERLLPPEENSTVDRIALVAVGGYGRKELAPFSDIDIMFLVPESHSPWVEAVSEYMLYLLWDLGLKVGHAIRSNSDCLKLAKSDLTIQTALLDARLIWGDEALYAEASAAFNKKIIAGNGQAFVEAKLAERDARHAKMGDTRYVVEPNLKEGKGGLRDLHTLFWIGRFLHGVERFHGLSKVGELTDAEVRQFRKAEDFLWTVRFYLHFLSNRAEERLTFDWQQELSEKLHYRPHPGLSGVERFMKHYFLVAKEVGDLTRIFCASLEEAELKKTLRRRLERRKKLEEFILEGDRLNFNEEGDVENEPVLMLKIFWVADQHGVDIHPDALRLMARKLTLINRAFRVREDANAHFMNILTKSKNVDGALRRMNEAGVFGRFVPDFGRIVAQSQFDMYHHFTVDEHTIQAIGLLSEIEKGNLAKEHPISTEVIQKIGSRRALFLAVLFHDIAKGRGGDHSELGAEVAAKEGPRLGLNPAEVEQVEWLVRNHLLMSHVAFKRDVSDPKTVQDFAAVVQSPAPAHGTSGRRAFWAICTAQPNRVWLRDIWWPGVRNVWPRKKLRFGRPYRAAKPRV